MAMFVACVTSSSVGKIASLDFSNIVLILARFSNCKDVFDVSKCVISFCTSPTSNRLSFLAAANAAS